MKKYKGKILSILIAALCIISIGLNTYAHSGRTDASGGHKDNKNKSGLGSYHYHCGGHPAHLHTNGVCPYSSSKKSTSSSSSNKSTTKSTKKSTNTKSTNVKSTTKTTTNPTTKAPTTVSATEIIINENIQNMEVGENKTLTATITPSNVTDKSVTWKSSNESIATITSNGEIIAKGSGTVNITASTLNGKTNTVTINVKEEPKQELKQEDDTIVTTTAAIYNSETTNNMNTNTIVSSENNSNPVGTVLALGILGGGGYLGYKKYSKLK